MALSCHLPSVMSICVLSPPIRLHKFMKGESRSGSEHASPCTEVCILLVHCGWLLMGWRYQRAQETTDWVCVKSIPSCYAQLVLLFCFLKWTMSMGFKTQLHDLIFPNTQVLLRRWDTGLVFQQGWSCKIKSHRSHACIRQLHQRSWERC